MWDCFVSFVSSEAGGVNKGDEESLKSKLLWMR